MTNVSYRLSYRAGYGTVVNKYADKTQAFKHAIEHEGSVIDKVYEERVWTYENYIADKKKAEAKIVNSGKDSMPAVTLPLTNYKEHLIDALSDLSGEDLEEVITRARERRYDKLTSRIGDVFSVNNCADTYWVCTSFGGNTMYGIKYRFSEEHIYTSDGSCKLPISDLTQVDKEVLRTKVSNYFNDYRKRISDELEVDLRTYKNSGV